MSEPLRLDPPVSGRSPRLRHALLACGLLLAALCCWWWLQPPGPTSVRAVVDGMVFPVVSPFSARVEAVFVAEGDRVRQGQVLARMDTTELKERFAAAGRETAALRAPSGPPGMEEMAQRLRAAQEAEQDMTRRLGLARHEEDMKRRVREERVAEHVRAQLHRRSLDNQGGEAAVGKARHTAAREAETRTRQDMERAAADFEAASRERAALDQELARIRQETEPLSIDDIACADLHILAKLLVDVLQRLFLPFRIAFRRINAQDVGARLKKSRHAFDIVARIDARADNIALALVNQLKLVLLVVRIVLAEDHVAQPLVLVDQGQHIELVLPDQIVRLRQSQVRIRINEALERRHEILDRRIQPHARHAVITARHDAE